jgi:hypothetical protein
MPTPYNTSQLLEIVNNAKLSWLERGKAVEELCQGGMSLETIVDLTGISKVAVSHQRICFLNLRGTAKEMCRSHKMHADASYTLAQAVRKDASLNQESVMRRAIALSEDRDSKRLKQGKGIKGRQTLEGQITNEDVKTALLDEKYKYKRS